MFIMKVKFFISYVILQVITNTYTFIIPDELPSILSVIYSNIPTLKKGTDSRVGWGFRLGDRADFQVLLELGPQINTQPLANQDEDGKTNKRNTLNNLANTLYAQRLQDKKNKEKEKLDNEKKTNSDNTLQNWLHTWSKTNQGKQSNDINVAVQAKPGIAIGEIDAKSVLPDDSTLEKLEKEQKRTKEKNSLNKTES